MNIIEACAFLDATIRNHLTDQNTEVVVRYVAPFQYSASIGDPAAIEPHVEVGDFSSIDEALIGLAVAIRDESDIGAQ